MSGSMTDGMQVLTSVAFHDWMKSLGIDPDAGGGICRVVLDIGAGDIPVLRVERYLDAEETARAIEVGEKTRVDVRGAAHGDAEKLAKYRAALRQVIRESSGVCAAVAKAALEGMGDQTWG